MLFWNNLINAALLGTARKPLNIDELLPEGLANLKVAIIKEGDQEDKYLQVASLAFNYRQCGALPLKQEAIFFETAPLEERQYCSFMQHSVLQEVLDTETISLLTLWLKACQDNEVIVFPEAIPALLDIAFKQTRIQALIIECCGKRGKWLSGFNSQWQFTDLDITEDLWTTGTLEQRKRILKDMLNNEAITSRAMLQQTWLEENANAKVDFLKLLRANLLQDDEPWLQSLLNDKSQKVKQEVWSLLRKLPGSTIIQKYKATLLDSIQHDGRPGGAVRFVLPEKIDEEIFKSGIDKVSSNKGVSDEEYILYQLIQHTPPDWLEQELNSDAEEIVQRFRKDKFLKKLIPAFADALSTFKNRDWAKAFFMHIEEFHFPVAQQLPQVMHEKYLIRYLEKSPEIIVSFATELEQEWSRELALAILKYTAQNTYRYNRGFYSQHIHLIPEQLVDEMNLVAPYDQYAMYNWNSLSEHIKRLLSLKKQIKQSFLPKS